MLYERVIAYVRSQPWAILPSYLRTMQEILTLRASGIRLSEDEIRSRIEAARAARGQRTEAPQQTSIGVVRVWGVISHRAAQVDDISGPSGSSAETLTDQIHALAAEPAIGAIVLDVDSPGGSVFGVPELADEIRSARAKKPIIAVANAMAASAAYWIASQATEFVVTPSGQVGSIGVYTMHEDWSENLKKDGIGVSLIKAGKYKIEANPFAPLDDEARAALQKEVDAYYAMFTKAVAKGRGVDVEIVRSGFGEGRMANAKDAVAMGMADRIATLDEVIGELVAGQLPSGTRATARIESQADALQNTFAEATEVAEKLERDFEETAESVAASETPQRSAEEDHAMYLRRMRLRNLELGAL